ncbi:hypothetical protein C8J56DRAFT_1053644 [Mycena floridula]|nr:hypothetical protein C8J56DRAFT_1053644 [Mycena floridula]
MMPGASLFPFTVQSALRGHEEDGSLFPGDAQRVAPVDVSHGLNINNRFPVEILCQIFDRLAWSWPWSGVCRKWYSIIRRKGWRKLAISARMRDRRLYPSVIVPGGPLGFVVDLDFTQCRCHPWEMLMLPWDRLNMRSVVIVGFGETTSFSLATQFPQLTRLELRGCLDLDLGGEREYLPKLRQGAISLDHLPMSMAPTLRELHLDNLAWTTLIRFQLWAASQANPFPGLTDLQLCLMTSDELFIVLPVLRQIQNSLISLGIIVTDLYPTGLQRSEVITVNCHPLTVAFRKLAHLRLDMSEYVLAGVMPLISWTSLSIMEIRIRYEGFWTWEHYEEDQMYLRPITCRVGSPTFLRRFGFDQLEHSSINILDLYCPCRGVHYASIRQPFHRCAQKVNFHDPFYDSDDESHMSTSSSDRGVESDPEGDSDPEAEAETSDTSIDVEKVNAGDSGLHLPVETYTWHNNWAANEVATASQQRHKQSRAWLLDYRCNQDHHSCNDLLEYQRRHPHQCGMSFTAQTTLQDYFRGPWTLPGTSVCLLLYACEVTYSWV